MSNDKSSKTEKPTAKRQGEARKEGRIAKSPELVSWASILIGATVMKSTVNKAAKLMQELMREMSNLISDPDQGKALHFFVTSVSKSVAVVAPLTLTFLVLGVVGHLAQVRFVLAFKAIKPSFSKLNPLTGVKRLVSIQSLFQAGKQLLKTIIFGWIAYHTLWATVTGFASNGPYGIGEIMTITSNAVMGFIRETAIVGVIIGVVDYFYQRKKTGDGMKMTKHEIKEEGRQQDLAPEVKGKMRQKQRQLSRNRMMASIKDADVVVVNPVHVAVALKYDAERGAPRVVAKGAGFVAEKIRERAEEEKVPMVQDIPLARTLHRVCEIDEEIPGEVFEAVARVLAFVFSLKSRGSGNGFHKMPGTPDLAEYEQNEASKSAGGDRPTETVTV